MDSITPAPTGREVDKLRAFLARQDDRAIGDPGQVLSEFADAQATQWQLADLAYDRAVEDWGRPPTEDEKRQIWAACEAPAWDVARDRRAQSGARRRSHPVTAAPRRVRVRSRERRSGRAARRTSSPPSGDASGPSGSSDGDGDPPPPDHLRRASQDRRQA